MPRTFVAAFAGLCLAACAGPEGPQGETGEQGPPGLKGDVGPAGPAGPLQRPPLIQAPVPRWGSSRSVIRIRGENLVGDPAAAKVTFDGASAEVMSAAPTELAVRPTNTVPGRVAVSVEIGNQTSNAVAFEVVPSGTARQAQVLLPSLPVGAVQVGEALFVASPPAAKGAAGLYRVLADGRTARVHAPPAWPLADSDGLSEPPDAPTCVTADATHVWFATALGSVFRYSVQSGHVEQILALPPGLVPFAALTGIARTAAGTLLVVDGATGQLIRLRASGSVDSMVSTELRGAFGIATVADEAFLTRPGSNDVARLSAVEGAWALTPGFATGAVEPRGVAVVGELVVVSDQSGALLSVSRADGGAFAPYVPSAVLRYQAAALSAAQGALLAAQPAGGVVRRVTGAGAQASARIVSAGLLPAFGAIQDGDALYLAMVGPALFASQASPAPAGVEDSVLLEVTRDGSSRLLARGALFGGLARVTTAQGPRLALSDCMERTIALVDPATGARSPLLDGTNGLQCPVGLHTLGPAELLYVDSGVFSGSAARVGRWKDAVHTADLVTGLPPNILSVVRARGELLMGGVGPTGPSGVYAVAEAGGAARLVIPWHALYGPAALAAAPDGTVYATQFGGDVAIVDLAGARAIPFARTRGRSNEPGQGESMLLTLTFDPSGAVIVPDFAQQRTLAIAP